MTKQAPQPCDRVPGWTRRVFARLGGAEREPVLFYAERDPAVLFGAWGAVVVIMMPFGLAIPDQFLSGVLLSLLMAWLCRRTFRFELTARRLHYRPNAFAVSVSVPLDDVRAVMATDLLGRPAELAAAPRRGHLIVRTETGVVVVKSIRQPQEAADAVGILQRRRPDAIPTAR